ncbi:MAG: hypothetical protein EOO42_09120 [Flavobacteriales bacterium]|nr:MAG: hypothetical protein EOO42_09120 [Flavobacteriales bacterium]
MKALRITLSLLTLFFMSCNSQDKETYWRINDIYREDKEPFVGLTGAFMQEILDYEYHFIKKNDSLYFDLPGKFQIDTKNFKSLRQLQLTDKDYYVMYANEFSGDTYKIKFKDNATLSKSKNTVIEFKKISKEEYLKGIEKVIAEQKEIDNKINALKAQLQKQPQIKLEPIAKLPSKVAELMNNKGEDVLLNVPAEIEFKESGDLKTEVFGPIKIGTLKDQSVVYDIIHKGEDYGLKQLTIWISSDTATFSMDKYLVENPNLQVFKTDKDNVVGYKVRYDDETDKAIVEALFCLKYYKVGNSHVFIYADVYRSQMKNVPNETEMNKILNFNYQISENITVKK